MNQHLFSPMEKNLLVDADAYKIPQWKAMRPGLTKLHNYGEPRVGGKYPFISFIGLSMIVQDHFLQRVTDAMIEEAQEEAYLTFGTKDYFNVEGWKRVRDLGYLPMKIMSAPEGGKYPISNVMFTTESTPEGGTWFPSMMQSLETLTMHTWYPTAVATRAMYIKEKLRPLFEKSGTVEGLEFAVNDFGARGATDWMADYRGGVGFLSHFQGSDNMIASRAVKHYYGYKGRAKSVYATEHSNALSFGPGEGELRYVLHELTTCPKDFICSIVIDTYDPYNHLKTVWCHPEVMALIKQRTAPTVARPDSGVPKYSIERCLDILTSIYSFGFNPKGYKLLNYLVRLLQGDGMTEDSIPELYEDIIGNLWSADNLVTGSGGGMLQVDLNRDTSRWAIKPSYGEFGDEIMNFQKMVLSDPTKGSKPGKLKLHHQGLKNTYMTVSSAKLSEAQFAGYVDAMKPLYHNGDFYQPKFEDILKRTSV